MSNTSRENKQLKEENQFDFWVGDWQVEWVLEGKSGNGTNIITKILDDKVIMENFDGNSSISFKGISLSVYDKKAEKWKQTWVDNEGNYLDFIGEFKESRMILQRSTTLNDKPILQRMVWFNISENELEWDWQRSLDDAKTWEILWHINYKRKLA